MALQIAREWAWPTFNPWHTSGYPVTIRHSG